jgi:type II secretory pathway pseudopilin PulG
MPTNNYILITLLMVLFVFGLVALQMFIRWQRQTREERLDEQRASREQTAIFQKMQQEASERQSAQLAQMLHSTLKSQEDLQRKVTSQEQREDIGLNAGGYIIFDMPESKKSMFHDLLKGFEDYAKIRGYVISFSIDNSFANKAAFKFTLDSSGIVVSTKQVRQDFKDYIEKVQNGDNLDDLPVVLSQEEHATLLACMKTRINFLQHNYNMEKVEKEFYRRLVTELPKLASGIAPPQNFFLQEGNSPQATAYNALNSPQAALGVGNRLIGNTLDQSVYIADSFNERTEQVHVVSDLWMKLYDEREKMPKESPEYKECLKAVDCLRKIENELKEGEPPEPKRIQKWLEQTKYALKAFGLTAEIIEAGKKLEAAFHLSDWIAPLIS